MGLDVLDYVSSMRIGNTHVESTDIFTVKPLFFPGGNIGHLAVSGVSNDLVRWVLDQ